MYLIVGASSGVGRAIAEEFAYQGHNLFLVSRSERDICAIASDLNLRYGVAVNHCELDLCSFQPDFSKIFEQIDLAGKEFKGVLIPAGFVIDGDDLAIEVSDINQLFQANCISIIKLITGILTKIKGSSGQISVVGFGSIASVRGRGGNMIYSTSKAATRFYFEALRHACVDIDVIVQYYILGYMNTNLAFAFNVMLPKGDPKKIAAKVYRDLEKDFGVRFFPGYWLVLSLIIKIFPWRLYRRLKF